MRDEIIDGFALYLPDLFGIIVLASVDGGQVYKIN